MPMSCDPVYRKRSPARESSGIRFMVTSAPSTSRLPRCIRRQQLRDGHLQCAREALNRAQAWIAISALKPARIGIAQSAYAREHFLAQAGSLAVVADPLRKHGCSRTRSALRHPV